MKQQGNKPNKFVQMVGNAMNNIAKESVNMSVSPFNPYEPKLPKHLQEKCKESK